MERKDACNSEIVPRSSSELLCVKVLEHLPVRKLLSFYQSITTTDFQVCLKDIQRYDAHHDPVTLNYMAAGCKYDMLVVLIFNPRTVFNCA